MENKLPRLTYKQQKFVMRYIQNGGNASEAYRYAYDCSKMSDKAINVEASKMLKNPNITLWIEHYQKNVQDFINEEIMYSTNDAFQELEELQQKSMTSSKTFNIAMKAIENKCKLKGLFTDKVEVSGGATVQMGSVEIDGNALTLKIGEPANEKDDTASTNS